MTVTEVAEATDTADAAPPGRRRWLTPLLAAVLAALLGASAVLWLTEDDAADPEPLTVARQEALNFFSLDYRRVDADIDRVLELATNPFEKQYRAARDKLAKSIVAKKLRVTATIPDDGVAIEYQRGDRAQVLVAVDAESTAKGGKTAADRYRARIALTRVDDQWLVSGVDQVG